MTRRQIGRMRRDGGLTLVAVVAIGLILTNPGDGVQPVTYPALAALVAPLVCSALFLFAEARRLARDTAMSTVMLRIGQVACALLVVAATADLAWRWGRLEGNTGPVTAAILVAAALTNVGVFHRCLSWSGSPRPRIVPSLMRRAMTGQGTGL